MKNGLVVKDNALINASYNLELTEQRLIMLAIINARELGQGITADSKLEIHASDYAKLFNVSTDASYKALKDAVNNLFNRQFSYTAEYKRTGKIGIVRSRWVSRIFYVDDLALLEITFAPDVVPLITRLEEQFTKYEAKQVAHLTSKYATRLYEILISWREVGKTPIFELQQLRKNLGVEDDEYQRMHHFKSRVLETAITQINEHTDIKASYEQYKQGRKVIGFTFKFKVKEKDKKKKAIETRDANTADMFTIEGLNDKQLGRIARNQQFIADYNHLVSSTSPAGQNSQAWEFEMINRLKRDPSQFNKRPIRDYLDC